MISHYTQGAFASPYLQRKTLAWRSLPALSFDAGHKGWKILETFSSNSPLAVPNQAYLNHDIKDDIHPFKEDQLNRVEIDWFLHQVLLCASWSFCNKFGINFSHTFLCEEVHDGK